MNTKDYTMNDKKSDAMIRALEQHLPPAPAPEPPMPAAVAEKEVQDDYEFSRKSYRDLVDKSNQAIEAMLELALQAEHPRAFEVLSTMLKNTSDMTDKLMDLQKKKKEMKEQPAVKAGAAPQLTQNNVFVGSTKELQQQMIKQLAAKNVTDAASSLQQS